MGATLGLWAVVTLPLGPCPGPGDEAALRPDARQLAEPHRPLPCVPSHGPGSEATLRQAIEGALGPLAPEGAPFQLRTERGSLRLDRYSAALDLGYLLTCGRQAPGLDGEDWGPGELGQDLGGAWSPRVLIVAADDPTWQGSEGLAELQRGVRARVEQLGRIPTSALPISVF